MNFTKVAAPCWSCRLEIFGSWTQQLWFRPSRIHETNELHVYTRYRTRISVQFTCQS